MCKSCNSCSPRCSKSLRDEDGSRVLPAAHERPGSRRNIYPAGTEDAIPAAHEVRKSPATGGPSLGADGRNGPAMSFRIATFELSPQLTHQALALWVGECVLRSTEVYLAPRLRAVQSAHLTLLAQRLDQARTKQQKNEPGGTPRPRTECPLPALCPAGSEASDCAGWLRPVCGLGFADADGAAFGYRERSTRPRWGVAPPTASATKSSTARFAVVSFGHVHHRNERRRRQTSHIRTTPPRCTAAQRFRDAPIGPDAPNGLHGSGSGAAP